MKHVVWKTSNKLADPFENVATNDVGLLKLTLSGLEGSFGVFKRNPNKNAKHVGLSPEVQIRIWH